MKIWTSEHTFNHPWETVATAAWRKYPNPHNPAVIGTDVVERQVVDGVLHTHRLVSSIWYFPRWAQAIHQPGDDYKEFLTICKIFLGAIPSDEVTFKVPGAMHHARWLAKALYCFKMYMFRSQFSMRASELDILHELIGSAKICYAREHSEVDPFARQMILRTINLTFCRHIAVNETLNYTQHPVDPTKTLLKQEAVVTVKGVPLNTYMEDLLTNRISSNAGKGRQAMEWVINKINEEVKDLTRSTDEIFNQTKKSIDDIANSAKKSMDDISQKAKKSFDDIQNLRSSNFSEI